MGNLCTGGIASTRRPPARARTGDRPPEPPQRGSSSATGRGGLLDGLRRRQAPQPDSGAHLQQIQRQVDGLLARASNHPDRQAEETDLLRLANQIEEAIRQGTPLPGIAAQLDYFHWRLQGVESPPPEVAGTSVARRLPPPGPDLHDIQVSETASGSDDESTASDGEMEIRQAFQADEHSAR